MDKDYSITERKMIEIEPLSSDVLTEEFVACLDQLSVAYEYSMRVFEQQFSRDIEAVQFENLQEWSKCNGLPKGAAYVLRQQQYKIHRVVLDNVNKRKEADQAFSAKVVEVVLAEYNKRIEAVRVQYVARLEWLKKEMEKKNVEAREAGRRELQNGIIKQREDMNNQFKNERKQHEEEMARLQGDIAHRVNLVRRELMGLVEAEQKAKEKLEEEAEMKERRWKQEKSDMMRKLGELTKKLSDQKADLDKQRAKCRDMESSISEISTRNTEREKALVNKQQELKSTMSRSATSPSMPRSTGLIPLRPSSRNSSTTAL